MVLDQPGSGRPILPLGVRLLAPVLVLVGMLELLCVVVAGLTLSLEWAPLLMMLATLAIGTVVTATGLSYGYAWALTGHRALVGLAVLAALASVAVPDYAYLVSGPVALMALPLIASIVFLERSGVRASLRPQETEQADQDRSALGRIASVSRSIGGLGLLLWGCGVALLAAIVCLQGLTSGNRWQWLGAVFLIPVAGSYAAPCLFFGFVIWRGRPHLVVTLVGFGLAVLTAGAMNPVWFAAAIPGAIAVALAIGLIAPPDRLPPYSALESK
jgi:hypothetical protein